MKLDSLSVAWRTWYPWLLATSVGWAVAWTVGHAIAHAVGASEPFTVFRCILVGVGGGCFYLEEGAPHGGALYGSVFGAVFGLVVAIPQWLVLRPKAARAYWWLLASTSAWALVYLVIRALFWPLAAGINFPLGLFEGGAIRGALDGAMGGLMAGLAQWVLLRKWVVHAGWWVLGSVIGVTAGWLVVAWLAGVGLDEAIGFQLAVLVGGGIAGLVVGAISGIVLYQLWRHPTGEQITAA